MEAASICGNVIACLAIVLIETRNGRSACLLFASSAYAAGWIVIICWPQEPWAYVVAQGIKGIAIAASFIICPIYTKEISQDSIRGVLGSFVTISEELGNILFAHFRTIEQIAWVCLSILVVHIMLTLIVPESPSFLLHFGNIEKTKKNLSWLRCRDENDPKLNVELEIMKKEEESDYGTNTFRIKALFTDVTLFRAFRIILYLSVARLFCGVLPLIIFGSELIAFTEEISPVSEEIMKIGSVIVCVAVEIVGRKMLLFGTFVVASINMFVIASMFMAKQYGAIGPPWLITIAISTLQLCDSVSLTWMPIITTEMFSFKYRGSVLCSTIIITSSALFLALKFRPLPDTLPLPPPFFALAVFCAGVSLYVWFYVPEVRNKTVEQIYEKLKG